MFANILNGTLSIAGTSVDYIRFGSGSGILVMLPGLGDGLTTVKGTALPMALMYRAFAKAYTVYMFSRPNTLRSGCTTREMASALNDAFEALKIDRCDLFGVSMGGMIAQHFAADYPHKVHRLVLAVTAAASHPALTESVSEWISLARQGDHAAFMDSNLRRMYSKAYYRRNHWLVPLTGLLTKPRSYERFLIQANACLQHDALDRLSLITAPTLVIGGEQDRALSPDASRELAAAIPNATLKMYPEWGHALYEEAHDFNQTVLDFLRRDPR